MADPRLDFAHQVHRFRTLKRHLLRRAYRRARPAVAVCEGVADGMQQAYGLRKDQVAVLRNFIDVDEVDRLASQPGPVLEPDCFHVVTAGRLDAQKGQRYLIEAVERLVHQRKREQIRLHVLGQGPLESELRSFVSRKHLDRYVRFEGFLSNPFAFIARCQLFCLPSLYEGLPLALLEAMACRIPVLATDCPSGPERYWMEVALENWSCPKNRAN